MNVFLDLLEEVKGLSSKNIFGWREIPLLIRALSSQQKQKGLYSSFCQRSS